MAYQTVFFCSYEPDKELTVKVFKDKICMFIELDDNFTEIYLDKSTAIRFSKTLRTEINKIEE